MSGGPLHHRQGEDRKRHEFQNQCLNCTVGRIFEKTSEACRACAFGRYQDENERNETICKACPVDTFISDHRGDDSKHDHPDDCVPCETGKFAAPAAQYCSNCVVGKFTLRVNTTNASGTVIKTICVDCDRGFYLDTANGSTGCKECPRGFSQNDEGSAFCFPCVPWRAPDRGQWNCTSCDPGLYAGETKQQSCKECEPGKYVDFEEASKCIPCSRGTATNKTLDRSVTSATQDISSLNLGTPLATHAQKDGQWNSEAPRCNPCSAGTFAATPASESCVPCAMGRFQAVRKTARVCGAQRQFVSKLWHPMGLTSTAA